MADDIPATEGASAAVEAPQTIIGGATSPPADPPSTDADASGATSAAPVDDAAAAADHSTEGDNPPSDAEEESTTDSSQETVELTADSYNDALTLPEGFTVDDALMSSFKGKLAAAGVKPEAAQGILDTYVDAQRQQAQAFADQQQKWLDEIRSTPEFTGENAAKSTAAIGRLMEEFGSDDVKAIFNATGAGNHPAVVSMFVKMANALGEGRQTPAGTPPTTKQFKSLGDLYR